MNRYFLALIVLLLVLVAILVYRTIAIEECQIYNSNPRMWKVEDIRAAIDLEIDPGDNKDKVRLWLATVGLKPRNEPNVNNIAQINGRNIFDFAGLEAHEFSSYLHVEIRDPAVGVFLPGRIFVYFFSTKMINS